MKSLLIGFSGKKRSGKDTAFEFLKELCDNRRITIQRFAFADALKSEVAIACDIDKSLIEQHKDTFRAMLQWWGTDFRRKFYDEEYWIKKLDDQVFRSMAEVNVVTDVRFPNEAYYVRNRGGIVVRVVRPKCDTYDSHASETAMDKFTFDHTLKNTTLKAFKAEVKRFYDKHIKIHIDPF